MKIEKHLYDPASLQVFTFNGRSKDSTVFDAVTGLAFSANGDGTLTVVREASPGNFEVTATVSTQLGSRTMAIDPITHYIHLPAAQFSQAKEPTPEGSRQRPVMARDSFEVLAVGK